jgi:hypothetical protein
MERGHPECACGALANRATVGKADSQYYGKDFYGCPNYQSDNKCGYWILVEDYEAGKNWAPRKRQRSSEGRPAASTGKLVEAYDQVMEMLVALEKRLAAVEAEVASKPRSIPS